MAVGSGRGVVDDAESPSFFYGICDGSGGFKENISEDENYFISRIIHSKFNE